MYIAVEFVEAVKCALHLARDRELGGRRTERPTIGSPDDDAEVDWKISV